MFLIFFKILSLMGKIVQYNMHYLIQDTLFAQVKFVAQVFLKKLL